MGILDSAPPGIYVKIWKTIVVEEGDFGHEELRETISEAGNFMVFVWFHKS